MLAVGALGGCGQIPPGQSVDPRTASPTPTKATRTPYVASDEQAARLRSLQATLQASRASVSAWKGTPAQASALDWAIGVAAEQRGALGVVAGPSPTPAAGPVPAASVKKQLDADAAYYRGLASGGQQPSAALWAAMAAWCQIAGAAVTAGNVRVQALGQGRATLPASAAPQDAGNDALAACHQVVYGLPIAISVGGWSKPDLEAVGVRLNAWANLRDALVDAITSLPGTPIAPQPYYQLKAPASAAAARGVVGGLQAAALPHLAVALDSGPASVRPTLAATVGQIAYDLTRWGTPVPRWPGLS